MEDVKSTCTVQRRRKTTVLRYGRRKTHMYRPGPRKTLKCSLTHVLGKQTSSKRPMPGGAPRHPQFTPGRDPRGSKPAGVRSRRVKKTDREALRGGYQKARGVSPRERFGTYRDARTTDPRYRHGDRVSLGVLCAGSHRFVVITAAARRGLMEGS